MRIPDAGCPTAAGRGVRLPAGLPATLLAVLLGSGAASAASAAGAAVTAIGPGEIAAPALSAPGAREVRVALLPLQLAYRLPHSFLAQDGDSARIGARPLVRGRDYLLDRDLGEIRVLASFAPAETLVLRYRILPLALSPIYGLAPAWRTAGPGATAATRVAPGAVGGVAPDSLAGLWLADGRGNTAAPGADATAGGPQLRLSGNKSVSLEFGQNRDAQLRQTFDLSATGRLGERTELVALLSDRSSSLTAAGGTLELSELDKLLVEVRSPLGLATLGDYTLVHAAGSFGAIQRELTGARARVSGAAGTAQGAVAIQKGRYRSLDFYGQEGRQGPYLLADESGAVNVPVVAGSEVVWLDGERMARGEAADYAVDYPRGRLTFTSRRPISIGSRIAVDYQLSGSPYRRRAAEAAGEARRGGLMVFGHAYREGDDAGHPLDRIYSDQDYAALAAAGDSAGAALAEGVFPGPGDYDEVEGPGGARYFAYAGPDSGALRVQFAAVGPGAGAYAESTSVAGLPLFVYVGEGAGAYAPGRRIPLPSLTSLVGGGVRWQIGTALRAEAEGAASARDLNRESGLDDGDNGDGAGRLHVLFEPRLAPGGRDLGALAIEGSAQRVGSRFFSPARLDSAFFQEDWAAATGEPLDGRDVRFGTLRYRPRPWLEAGGERAHLSADGGFVSDRWRGTLRTAGGLAQRLRIDRVEARADVSPGASGLTAEGYRDKLLYDARWAAKPYLTPAFVLDHEERVPPATPDSAAVRYRSWDASVDGAARGATWGAGFGFRRDFTRADGVWNSAQTARTGRLSWTAAPSRAWTLAGGASRRWLEQAASGRNTVDNGYGRARNEARGGRLTQEGSAEWTSEVLFRRVREVLFVGSGEGAYDSLGNFTGEGDYTVRLREDPGATERVARASFSYRLGARPFAGVRRGAGGGAAGGRGWRDLRVGTLIQSAAGRRGALEIGDFLATPRRLAQDAGIASGSFLWRQEVESAPEGRVELLLRIERRGLADRQYEGFATVQGAWVEEGRVRVRSGPAWLFQWSGLAAQREAFQTRPGGAGLARELDELSAGFEATYARGERLQLTGFATLERVAARGEETWVVTRLGPRVVYAAGDRLRAESQLRVAAVRGDRVPTLLPEGFAVRADRFDFRVNVAYRLRQRVNLTLDWSGRAGADGGLTQTARTELRAFFE
jgi:hypothetical protein